MKILVYGISRGIGGISEYMMNINENINLDNIHFDYMICGSESIYEEKIKGFGEKVFYYTKKEKNFIKNIKDIYKIMKENRKDHDIFYYNTSGVYYIYPYLMAIILKYKIVTHAHSIQNPKLNRLLVLLNKINRFVVNNTTKIKIACSDLAAQWIFGNKNEDVIIINNGVNLERYKYNLDVRNSIRKKYGVADNEIIIGNVGRLCETKNQSFLIDIFNIINKEKNFFKLWLVGDGQEYEILNNKVKKLNLKNVKFFGNKKNVNELMQAMDIFVFPSKYEGFPVALVEAQAAGLKCLVSDTITKDVDITGLVEFIDINDSEKVWKEKIYLNSNYKRKDMTLIMEKLGFSQRQVSRKIEEILLKKFGEKE